MSDAPKRGPGRPRLDEPHSYVLRVRLTEEQRRDLERRAVEAGMATADYVRTLLTPPR